MAPGQAKDHVGKTVVVTGRVAEVAAHDKLVYLNFEKPFPDTPFMAVVFAVKAAPFGDLTKLKGCTIEVSGKVIAFRERPEIIIEKPEQLRLLAGPGGANK